MRCVLIAGLGLVGLSGEATAQGARYPVPGAQAPRAHVAPGSPVGGRWGSKIDGRWWAGANAPGGYAAYRRPVRGAAVPTYWNAPRFYVTDWQSYGLPQPPVGYNWVRYYDDAVLLDARGSIHDTEFGVDWDRFDRRPSYAGDQIDTGTAFRSDGYASDGYGRRDRGHEDRGRGGAAIGAVAGGALGATVAGRGDRLGGALIGAGVGGIAGYAVDKAEDRGRYVPPPRYGAPYGAPAYPYPPEPHGGYGRSSSYTTTVPAGGSHVVHTGPGITTITVQTQPVTTTTTTTTEYVDDAVTYSRPARRVYRSKLRRR